MAKVQEKLKLCWQHRQQFKNMAAGSTIIMAGGMKFAWCIFEEPAITLSTTQKQKQLLMISWFLGAVLGALLGSKAVEKLSPNVINCLSAALLMSGGLLTFTFPTHTLALLSGCILEGCAQGLSQLQCLLSVAALAHIQIHGLLISNERISLWFGIWVQLLCTRLWFAYPLATNSQTLHENQLHGIIIACLGLLATLLTLLQRWTLETPQQLECGIQEVQPLQQIQQQVSQPCKPNTVTCVEPPARSHFSLRLLPLLLKLLLLRGFVALPMSLPFNRAFLIASWGGFDCDINCLYVLAACGLLGSTVGGLLVDSLGRRQSTVSSLLLGGMLIFVVGGMFDHLQNCDMQKPYQPDFEVAASLQLAYQFVTCVGVGVASSVYLAEAFNGPLKSTCIAVVLSCEHMLQIILTLMARQLADHFGELFLAIGLLNLIFGLLAICCLPEIMLLSLQECRRKLGR